MYHISCLRVCAILTFFTTAFAQTLNFVAHQDDDLLFLSPDLLHNVESGATLRTIILTAGDSGLGSDYWNGRQAGSMAAYAHMAGVANEWSVSDAGINGYPVSIYTLNQKPSISLGFMHLPDGNMDGSGFRSTGFTSLQKLWEGTISSIRTVDESGTMYTKSQLVSVLSSLIKSFNPSRVNTMDYMDSFGGGDHSDHYATAFFVKQAVPACSGTFGFVGYMGYPINERPVNLAQSDIEAKQTVFYTYGEHDMVACSSGETCANKPYAGWLQRQYTV